MQLMLKISKLKVVSLSLSVKKHPIAFFLKFLGLCSSFRLALWLIRAGKYGEIELYALENNSVTIGWNENPDLSTITAKKDLEVCT